MFSEKYKHMINQVQPDDKLLGDVLKASRSGEKNKKASSFRRPALAVIALCLCFSLAVPALAATVEPVYRLMYMVSPSIAQFFMPVQKSVTDNGIKMEVVSAYIHDSVAEIYITMQDLTGERVDATTDLYDSYSINRPFDSSASCELVGYEEKTKTATFLISITEWGDGKIDGDKITFSVKEFLSHKKKYSDIKIPIDLSAIKGAINTQTVNISGGGGKDFTPKTYDGKELVLTPSQAIPGFPVDGIDLTAIGYIDGMLHVQIALKDRLKTDNHGSLYLKDASGNKLESKYRLYFTNKYKQQNDRIDYYEFAFDIPREKLRAYSLYGDFVTSGMLTRGNWRVTFPLEQAKS